MCTATYLPLGPTGFVLTHSRDEKAIRPAARPPQTVRIGELDVTFPQDPQGQGTWIALGRGSGFTSLTVCLLNGAFAAHTPRPPYKHSRGLVVLDVFRYGSIDSFVNQYSFTGIEPFTLLLAETNRLIDLQWDGKQLFISEKDARKPHIWSSVTLYSAGVIRQRESWFWHWLQCSSHPSVEAIRHFHQFAGDGDPRNSLRMNRQNTLLTVSLTSVVHTGKKPLADQMIYEDFTQNQPEQPLTRPSYATA